MAATATQFQLRRGSTIQNDEFTGAVGELTYDTDRKRIRIRDGSTPGGYEIPRYNEVVHLSGAENIGGVKTFTSNPVVKKTTPFYAVLNPNIDLTKTNVGTADQANYQGLIMADKSYKEIGYTRSVVYYNTTTNKNTSVLELIAIDPDQNHTNEQNNRVHCQITLVTNGVDGQQQAYLSYNPLSTSNGKEIATTKFVNDKVSPLSTSVSTLSTNVGTLSTNVSTLTTTVNNFPKVPTGTIVAYAGTAAPSGWLMCNGQAVSRTTYSSLFAIVSTAYGAGDGSTTFNLPNYTDRVAQGLGRGYLDAGLPNIKGTLGSTSRALTSGQIAALSQYATLSEIPASGALSATNLNSDGADYTSGGSASLLASGFKLNFNANSSNGIYKDSVTTVQPKAVKTNWIIKY